MNHAGMSVAFVVLRWLVIAGLTVFAARRSSLSIWILLAMVAGTEFGCDAPQATSHLQILAAIFLRLIKVIIAPLLISTLMVGVAGHADLKKLGRLAWRTLLYFEVVSSIALLIGFAAMKLTHAGLSVPLASKVSAPALSVSPPPITDLVLNMFPENIAKSVADEQLLQVVLFSTLLSIALALISERRRQPLLDVARSLSAAMIKMTSIVMYFAPFAVFGAMAYAVGHLGFSILFPLLHVIATMYCAVAIFVLVVLLPIALYARIPIRRFIRAVANPVALAFSTASSEAALPSALEKMELLGVEEQTASFVLAVGYSFNLDGSSLYEALAVMFIAQVARIHLSSGQEALIILALLISSKGTAGVARASLVIVLGVAASFRLPLEPIALLFAIDQVMDMLRTALNVLGNCLATVVMSRVENEPNLFSNPV